MKLKLFIGLALAGLLISVVPAASGASPSPTVLTPPQIPGVPALPFTGEMAPTFTISTAISNLNVTPDQGTTGTPMTISGQTSMDSTVLTMVWSTASATWQADVEPNTVNYLGTSYSKFNVILAQVTTSPTGSFSLSTTAPADFGGTHDIYALSGSTAVAHGGFELLRILKVSPRSGPVGTPITVTYTSMGASLYTGGASVLWDNHYAGEMMANWTRGTATVTIRAAGPPGVHYLSVGNAISYMYLNVAQSPIPFTNGATVAFTVTPSVKLIAPYISWPAKVSPTLSEVTTLLPQQPSSLSISLSSQAGPVLSKPTMSLSGLTPGTAYHIVFSTVVGNRVNCQSTCWSFSSIPMTTLTPTTPTISLPVTIPDNLGGFHVIQVLSPAGDILAQAPYYVRESILPFYSPSHQLLTMGVATADDSNSPSAIARAGAGTPTYTFKQGQEFTISIKGVGWTQLDNTLGVTYDNSYMGYGCGFNSNGYMVIHLHATGGPGLHVVDLYPMLYSLSPSFANTPYGMVPVLSSARDFPGLALGYAVPQMHFMIRVVR